jgi:hypothetical protein
MEDVQRTYERVVSGDGVSRYRNIEVVVTWPFGNLRAKLDWRRFTFPVTPFTSPQLQGRPPQEMGTEYRQARKSARFRQACVNPTGRNVRVISTAGRVRRKK